MRIYNIARNMCKSLFLLDLQYFQGSKMGPKFFKFGQFLLCCVREPVNFDKNSKLKVFGDMIFPQISMLGPLCTLGPNSDFVVIWS